MARAQGSLEYLIILAAVLAIAAVTVLFLTGVTKGQSSTVSVATCKQASDICKLSQLSSPNDPCLACNAACVNQVTGKEIFNGATLCCTQGKDTLIYSGSTDCASLACGNGKLDSWEVCDGSIMGTCTGTGATCTGCKCYCSDGTLAEDSSGPSIDHCSSTKPKYCDSNGNLVDKCGTCGCPVGACIGCQADGTCVTGPVCGLSCCQPGQSCCGNLACCQPGQYCNLSPYPHCV